MLTLSLLLVLSALVATVASAVGSRVPLWVPVFLLALVHLLPYVPR